MWFSKHNYAFELSKYNYVVFVNPPLKYSLRKLFLPPRVTKVADNLFQCTYTNILPTRYNILNYINNYLVSIRLRKHILPDNYEIIFWAFDPTRLFDPALFKSTLSLYHCVDHYYLKFYAEKMLIKNVNYLFSTSTVYFRTYSRYNKVSKIVPHGIALDEFCVDTPGNDLKISKPYCLSIGKLNDNVAYDVMETLIKCHPEILFVFAGLICDDRNPAKIRIFDTQLYDNVVFLGTIPYKNLKYLISDAVACLLLKNMSIDFATVHAHKMLQYLALGKPVFGHLLQEYSEIIDLAYLFNTDNEIVESFSRYFIEGESKNLKAERIAYAKQFTFDRILGDVDIFLSSEANVY